MEYRAISDISFYNSLTARYLQNKTAKSEYQPMLTFIFSHKIIF